MSYPQHFFRKVLTAMFGSGYNKSEKGMDVIIKRLRESDNRLPFFMKNNAPKTNGLQPLESPHKTLKKRRIR